MKNFRLLSIGLALLLSLPANAGEWREVAPGDRVRLPRDLVLRNEYRVQWWYFTGHLFDGSGREFGYELTFFAAGVQKKKYRSQFGVTTIYLSHFAVTDGMGKRYYHSSNAESGASGIAGADAKRLHVWVDKDSLEGTLTKMHVKADAIDAGLELDLVPVKPVVLNGERGYSRKSEESPTNASLYFSLTNLATRGTVRVGSAVFRVKGKSWFDRELSSRGPAKNEAGWDWFALQLDDGREIMLYSIRKKDESVDRYSSGTVVSEDGTYRRLVNGDFDVTVLNYSTAELSRTRYPSKWSISIPSENLRLLVIPLMQDQEFTAEDITGSSYWEGACRVEGGAKGRAYVEMTGYGKNRLGEGP